MTRPLYGEPVEREPAEARPTFTEWARETCRRRILGAAIVISVALVAAWIVGRIVLAGRPENAPGARYVPAQIGIALAGAAVMHALPLARRRGEGRGTAVVVRIPSASHDDA